MKMGFNHLSLSILNQILLLLTLLTILGYTKGCTERERLALLDFKTSFALSSQNNSKLSSWNSRDDAKKCCSWEGIVCDNQTGHVISLDLSDQFLESNHLRPSLVELQYLRSLNLNFNNLAMRIPKFIGSFSKLTSLYLDDVGFFGTIPPQLGNLSKIQTLDLSGNKLSIDNLEWLSRLSSLESLDMSLLNFTSDWVPVIRKLPVLSYFNCWGCYFPTQDFPSTSLHPLNFSSSLQTLRLDSSHLSTSSLASLLANHTQNLLKLSLPKLELEAPFPSIFHDMISLETLDLSYNHLEDGIFNSMENLCKLKYLVVSRSIINQSLTNTLRALSHCGNSSLEQLDLSFMNLTGTIPPMLKLQSLVILDLSSNKLNNLQNTLPLFPTSLAFLSLANNNLSGVLSDQHFTTFSQLESLSLSNNPNLIVSFNKPLSSAYHVDLRSCNLGPTFPSWLLSQNSFSGLDISHSKISGTIPIMFWRNIISPYLHYLNLSANSFHGIVPDLQIQFSLNDLTIDLSSNAFGGPIPSFLFLANGLFLSKNNFSGFAPIPHHYNLSKFLPQPYIDSKMNLRAIVDLSNNLLSGQIPHWLGFQIPNLGALILANNNLSGTIPSSIVQTSYLYVLSVSNNSFSGPLPSLLKSCSELRILDFSGNRFSGIIPSWIGEDLKSLTVLSLRSNHLTGILPTSLCHLSSLQILDVSRNFLFGSIPSCIHNFTGMARDVGSNLLVSFVESDTFINTIRLEETPYFNAYIQWKRRIWKFGSTLHLLKLIDLSSNNLSGVIPTGLTSLVELDSVDLSFNNLQGSIPEQIGQLKSLQYLNFSYNKLNGQIPPSLSEISSLEILDFSHNSLSGRIPKGTQLQTFEASAFAGNPELCDLPLKKCLGDKDNSLQPSSADESEAEDKKADKRYFYGGMGTGFAFGSLGIFGTVTWMNGWTHAFF